MPIEMVRGPVLIRSWRQSDAAGLARVIADNLDHLRPWLPWESGVHLVWRVTRDDWTARQGP